MTGPRVSTGVDSKQDYQTPIELKIAVEKRFGFIQFDLAAHSGNTLHKRYFAPSEFVKTGTAKEVAAMADLPLGTEILEDLKRYHDKGAVLETNGIIVSYLKFDKKKSEHLWKCRTKNTDPNAWGFDAFKHSWSSLSKTFGFEKSFDCDGHELTAFLPGLLWNNCEFDDIKPWAAKHAEESKQGSNTLLLTPASVGSNWARDYVYPYADVYLLNDRICFDGKNVYPKDCMLSHYHPGVKTYGPSVYVWSWVKDKIYSQWKQTNA